MSYSYGRRRRSVFGGLLLILIGVLFLIHNLDPGLLRLGEVVRYWPVLLILWGLARLWDYLAANRSGQPAPRAVSGGDLLLILLVLVGVMALLTYNRIHRDIGWQGGLDLFANPYTFTTTLPSEPVEPSMQVKFWTPRGNITVHPQPARSVNVIVTKTVHAASEKLAREVADATAVAIEKSPVGLDIRARTREHGNERVSYDASVFPGTSLFASTGRGSLHVTGVRGQIALNASGQVEVSGTGSNTTVDLHRGDARIHAVEGNVTINGRGQQVDIGEIGGGVSINGEFYGPIRVRKVSKSIAFHSRRTSLDVGAPIGRVDMDSGRMVISDTPGNVSLATRDKDIELENVRGAVHVSDRNGNIEVRYSQPPRSSIDITNHSGDINIVLPGNSAFSITAMAHSGDISNDFRTAELKLMEQSSNTILEGTVGSGGPKITLNTTYGTIHIRRTTLVPPFPPPVPRPARPPAPTRN